MTTLTLLYVIAAVLQAAIAALTLLVIWRQTQLLLTGLEESRKLNRVNAYASMSQSLQSVNSLVAQAKLRSPDIESAESLLCECRLNYFDQVHGLWQKNLLDAECWEAELAYITYAFADATMQSTWPKCRTLFRESFRDLIDQSILPATTQTTSSA